jgi:DNA-binding CsgD family transcriptional regulator
VNRFNTAKDWATQALSGPLPLSATERTVANYISQGLTNKQIADRLSISVRTVDTHVSHSLAKLGVTSRVQIALLLARQVI